MFRLYAIIKNFCVFFAVIEIFLHYLRSSMFFASFATNNHRDFGNSWNDEDYISSEMNVAPKLSWDGMGWMIIIIQHSTSSVQNRNFCQSSTWFCSAKGEKYIEQLWQIHVTTLNSQELELDGLGGRSRSITWHPPSFCSWEQKSPQTGNLW